MFARELNTPADIVYGLVSPEPSPTYDDFVEQVRDKMIEAHDIARENMRVAAKRNKRYYDLKVKPAVFHEGDLVYYYNPRKFVGRSEKWARKYSGPFRIIKELSPVTMLLQPSNKKKAFVSHVDKLKLCSEGETDSHSSERQIPHCTAFEVHNFDQRPRRNANPPRRLISEC